MAWANRLDRSGLTGTPDRWSSRVNATLSSATSVTHSGSITDVSVRNP